MIDSDYQANEELLAAQKELGIETFNAHFREVFGIPCLDFVNSMESNQQSYKSEVEDLANKLYLVQNRVRAAQRSKTHQNGRSM